ncbi:putative amino acid permease 7 [Hordeum vulgare]|nr:putative amino acid permease 7 [Hordeum vulgare]
MAIPKANCYHAHGHDAPCGFDGSYYMLMFGGAQLLLSFIPDFHDMAWLSVVAAVMSFSYAFIALGLGLASTILLIVFGSTDTLKSPPAENKSMKKASIISILVTTFFYLCCGCFGYAAFGSDAPGNLLTGFGFYKPYWGALLELVDRILALLSDDQAIVFFFTKALGLLANLLLYVRACLSPMAPWPREEECSKQGGGAQVHDHGADPLGGGHFEFLQNHEADPPAQVDRKSNPPVCKIMDFYKEKYNKDAQQKQCLKTKSAIALRGGDIKDVRFKAKTEIKDMKVKADAITRLMERGYKVKCMAMPAGNEAEDLGGPLSRLLGLVRTPFCTMEHLKRIAEEMQKQVAVPGAIQPKEENDLEFGCII